MLIASWTGYPVEIAFQTFLHSSFGENLTAVITRKNSLPADIFQLKFMCQALINKCLERKAHLLTRFFEKKRQLPLSCMRILQENSIRSADYRRVGYSIFQYLLLLKHSTV